MPPRAQRATVVGGLVSLLAGFALGGAASVALARVCADASRARPAPAHVVVVHSGPLAGDALQVRRCGAPRWGGNALAAGHALAPGAPVLLTVAPGCLEIRVTRRGAPLARWRLPVVRSGAMLDVRDLALDGHSRSAPGAVRY